MEINCSAPIVPFRETIVPPPKLDMLNEAISEQSMELQTKNRVEFVEMWTPNKRCRLRIRPVPLPLETSRLLEDNVALIKAMNTCRKRKAEDLGAVEGDELSSKEEGLAVANLHLQRKIAELKTTLDKTLTDSHLVS